MSRGPRRDRPAPRPLSEMPDPLTISEVAEVLRVSEGIVYRLIREDEMPAVRIGGKKGRGGVLLMYKEDLEAYVARMRGKTAGG